MVKSGSNADILLQHVHFFLCIHVECCSQGVFAGGRMKGTVYVDVSPRGGKTSKAQPVCLLQVDHAPA